MKKTEPSAHWLKPPGPVAPGLRIGLLGGSFNPAHEGHLYVSEVAMKKLGLDYVWWLVSPQNPLKPTIGMAPLEKRLAYAAAKFEKNPRIFVLDIEKQLRTRYTINTISKLRRRFSQVQFVWLMGSDNLATFRLWRRWPEILKSIPVAVVLRPGTSLAPLHAKPLQRVAQRRCDSARFRTRGKPELPCFTVIDGHRNYLSSTQIRGKSSVWECLLVGAIPA